MQTIDAVPSVILLATQRSHWGACRFASAFRAAGFRVTIVAGRGSLIAQGRDRAADRFVPLRAIRFIPWMRADLERAVALGSGGRIVPTDERAFALLARLIEDDEKTPGSISPLLRATIEASVGDIRTLPLRGHKTEIQGLARRLRLAVPAGALPSSAEQAAAAAAEFGYPVLLKLPTGAGGGGLSICKDEEGLLHHFERLNRPPSVLKQLRRRLLRRDWYVTTPQPYLQKLVAGQTGITCAYAENGRTIAVLSALSLAQRAPTRPCTAIRLLRHPSMEEATMKLVAALGASGFISFDFILDEATGEALVLECNPRPIQMMPLGPRVGVDLCRAMAEAMRGTIGGPVAQARSEENVALFPQEWLRDPASTLLSSAFHDVPWNEPALLRAMMARAQRNKRSDRRQRDEFGPVLYLPPDETRGDTAQRPLRLEPV